MSRTAAILLAAGSSKRMQGVVPDKVLAPLDGRPVFAHSAAAFATSGVADLYVVVYRDREQMMALSAFAPTPSLLVRGGKRRQDSVGNALDALPDDIGFVFIHDCARPLIRPEQLVALHKIVRKEEAAILAHPVTDTIKKHRGDGRLRTLERSSLWAAETPQVFSRRLICLAHEWVASKKLKITDDAAAVEEFGHCVALLENTLPNPKITSPSDFAYVEFLLANGG